MGNPPRIKLEHRRSRHRRFQHRWLYKACLVIGGLCLGVLVAELILRGMGIGFPLPYMPDPYCGSKLRPGFQAWFTKEGRAYVRVNASGFRDRDHVLEKPANTVRIAVLGDSYAEALQVPFEDTFWHLLGEELMQRKTFGPRKVEVLNFGISGYGTAQELMSLRHYALAYHPDIVILAFFSGNDIRNNSEQLEPYRVRPFFRVSGEELVLDDRFRTDPDYLKATSPVVRLKVRLINASRILQVANEWRNQHVGRDAGTPASLSGIERKVIFAEPEMEAWTQAWSLTERLIEQIHRECDAVGARFVLVCVTNPIQVDPNTERREEYTQTLGVSDLFYSERRLETLARHKGFEIVPLAERMQRYADDRGVFLHGFANSGLGTGHWNERGHAVAARYIAEAISSP